jgi:hypothetical protein
MASTLAIALQGVGAAISCVGVVMQFVLDQQGKREEQKIADIRDYIDMLDQSVDDLEKEDKTQGRTIKDGVDIGEAFEILRAAAEQANKENRKKMRKLVDQVGASASRRLKIGRVALGLILLGIIVSAVAAGV